MKPVVDVETMRASDAATIAGGVSGRELMMRAARGVFELLDRTKKIAIVCGSGNNAGDGYALALLLAEAENSPTVLLLSDRFSSDGAFYFEHCKEQNITMCRYTPAIDLSEYDIVVDCIFGTGFRGEATGESAEVIRRINESGAYVVSVDINSGLDGESGMTSLCVSSDLTVSIGTLKNGLLLNSAKDHIGRLVNVDIGIAIEGKVRQLCEIGDFKDVLKPRPHASHKGNYGYVSILGGCPSYSGAVKLANLACASLRAGCGVTQLILPQSLASAVAPYLLESTMAVLPDADGHLLFDAAALDRVLAKQAALAVGMGCGRSDSHAPILKHVLQNYAFPLLIDADGLNTLAEMDKSVLKETRCRVILTPHLKEMERLCGFPLAEIAADPIRIAERFAHEWGVILLLKGTCTVVTDGEETLLVDRGCAGMATAGSGDVLSGILAGLLGYAPPTVKTVACGAFLAGLSGELAQRDTNAISMMASDTVAHIAEAVGMIQ